MAVVFKDGNRADSRYPGGGPRAKGSDSVTALQFSRAADMTKARELREMSDEQIRLVWKDSAETLFKLRLQAQTEKLASSCDMKKLRRSIARCQTILTQRGTLVVPANGSDGASAEPKGVHDAAHGAHGARGAHGKHAKKKRSVGRAEIKEPGKADVVGRRGFKKQTQTGE